MSDTARTGPKDALTDVAGLRVGHWSRGPTGVTVVLAPPEGAVCAVDVRGAAPATRETDALRPGNLVRKAHAVVLCGGSAFGLAAADGVARWLEAQGIGFPVAEGHVVPIVPAAALYDLGCGGNWTVRPDAELGRRACEAAGDGPVGQGNVGAGAGARAARGGIKGGIGTASAALTGGSVVGALVVVNAFGSPFDPVTGRLYAAGWDPQGEFEGLRPHPPDLTPEAPTRPGAHTTLAVVATDVALEPAQAAQVAQMAHDGLARAIVPIHTTFDGDAVFALSTGARAFEAQENLPFGADEAYKTSAVGAAAAAALTRAVGHAVLQSQSAFGVPGYRERWLEKPRSSS